MYDFSKVLTKEELAVLKLRAIYSDFGYEQYKMSKFEEYDLYAKNKSFLLSDNLITFTDTDGKLMALKPDVTLSIVKNTREIGDGVKKVYYDENVYRVAKGTKTFKEIKQVGLECLGKIDKDTLVEVLTLAQKSLNSVDEEYVLEVSSLEILSSICDLASLSQSQTAIALNFISQKNLVGLTSYLKEINVSQNLIDIFSKVVTVYGKPEKVIRELKALPLDQKTLTAIENFSSIIEQVQKVGDKDKIIIDFSVVLDVNYYDGIVFNGVVAGVPTVIISGGQYDNLMEKMGKKMNAVGFAVYIDELVKLKR